MGAFCSSFCSFFFGCLGHQTHDPKGTSLVKDRSCTDKLILLLYIAAWVGSVIVISMAAKLGGNPFKIINAVDMEGNICGYSEGFKDKSLGALVNPLMTDTSLLDVWRCVDSCDQTQDANNAYFAKNYVSTSCQQQQTLKQRHSDNRARSVASSHLTLSSCVLRYRCLLQSSVTAFRRSTSPQVAALISKLNPSSTRISTRLNGR